MAHDHDIVRNAMSTRSPRLPADTSVATAAHAVWGNNWLPVPLLDDSEAVVGTLSIHDIVRAVAQRRDPEQTPAVEVALSALPTLDPGMPLADAAGELERTGSVVAFVVEDGKFLGALTHADIKGHELIASELGPLAATVNREVAPQDLMYGGSWGAYAFAGVTAVQVIREMLAKYERPAPAHILDLPCGHGRELRFLKVVYPDARYTACDIDADGVEFCARVFDAVPVVSDVDPAQVSFEDKFDLAWCGSLFTHLSGDRWPGFLDLFARAMEPGGLFLFSCNGFLPANLLRDLGIDPAGVQKLLHDFEQSDFGYVDVADGTWGLSIARPRWVKEQIENSPLELLSYERWAWKPPFPAQDVLVCTLPS
jgi:CBS domain-containing protein